VAYCTVADVKARARLGPTDTLDDARVQDCVDATARLIDDFYGWPADPPVVPDAATTAILRQANIKAALELVSSPTFGIYSTYEDIAVRVSPDPLAGVRGLLLAAGLPAWGLS
jgi:hypothetical protein